MKTFLTSYLQVMLVAINTIFCATSCGLDKQNNDTITIIEKGTNIKFIIKYNTENVHVIEDNEVLIYVNDSTNITKKCLSL